MLVRMVYYPQQTQAAETISVIRFSAASVHLRQTVCITYLPLTDSLADGLMDGRIDCLTVSASCYTFHHP